MKYARYKDVHTAICLYMQTTACNPRVGLNSCSPIQKYHPIQSNTRPTYNGTAYAGKKNHIQAIALNVALSSFSNSIQ
jgi:hypothetical protein